MRTLSITSCFKATPRYIYGLFPVWFILGYSLFVPMVHASYADASADARQVATLGILAIRDKGEVLQRWQPLADYLSARTKTWDFIIAPMHHAQMKQAILAQEVDFVLTNPVHYIYLAHQAQVPPPLVMLVEKDHARFGGVILTRSHDQSLHHLTDIVNRRIASVGMHAFGSFLMQAYELHQADLPIPKASQVLATGLPQDKVVQALLDGFADVAFVRTGIIESMIREGTLDPDQIRIIAPREYSDFPFAVSTRLYPDWPLARTKHTNLALARELTIALLSIDAGSQISQAVNIEGFMVPDSYDEVRQVLQVFNMPPFDQVTPVSLYDIWHTYRFQITVILLCLSMVLLTAIFWRSWCLHRQAAQSNLALSASRQELDATQTMLRNVFDILPVGIKVIDPAGEVLMKNQAADEILGFMHQSPEDELCVIREDGSPLPPDEYTCKRALHHHQALTNVVTGIQTLQGTTWLSVSALPIHDTRFGAVICYVDVTASKLTEDKLRHSKDEAEKASQAKSEFLSRMSHELRTPMNAILGFAQLLEIDEQLDEETTEYVKEILVAGHHLLNLINEVLDLARVEAGHMQIVNRDIPLWPLLDECIALMRPLESEKQITIELDCDQAFYLRADATRIKQVLLNILSNAIKYNREGGKVYVSAKLIEAQQSICIEIADTGAGIPAHRLNELFEPFNRLDAENSTIRGTGIGLAISRRLLDVMHGTIRATNAADGMGAIFTIELPGWKKDLAWHDKLHTNDKKSFTLLQIDANPSNLKLVQSILYTRSHIRLLSAMEVEVGLQLIRRHKPDVILLDTTLLDAESNKLLTQIQELAKPHRPYMIAMRDALSIIEDDAHKNMKEFDMIMEKPLAVEKFLVLLDQLCA